MCTWDPFKNIIEAKWTIGNYVAMIGRESYPDDFNETYMETMTGVMSGDETLMCWTVICWTQHKSGKGDNHVNLTPPIIFKIRDRYATPLCHLFFRLGPIEFCTRIMRTH